MKFAIETGGAIAPDPGEVLDRAELERLFDLIATALAQTSEFEADVAINFETSELEFFIVVEATDAHAAVNGAEAIVNGALQRAGLRELDWSSLQAKRADLIPV